MEFSKKNIRIILGIILFTAVIFTIFENIPTVLSILGWLFNLIYPIILGFAIGFVLNILLKIFEEKIFAKLKKHKNSKIRAAVRPLSIVGTLLVAFGIFTIIMLVVLPEIIQLFKTLGATLPQFIKETGEWLNKILQRFDINQEILQNLSINWQETINKILSSVMKGSEAFISSASGAATGVISFSTNLVLDFVIAIYGLAQKEQIARVVKATLGVILPRKINSEVFRIAKLSDFIFSKFIIGQLTEAVILGALCFVGMIIFRFPYALVISVFLALTALIPIIGAFLGGGVGVILILMESPVKALFFLIFLLILQQLEGDFIYPKVVGKTVGLPSLLVLIVIIIGGNIGGITGILLSVPIAAVFYTLFKEFIDKKEKKLQK